MATVAVKASLLVWPALGFAFVLVSPDQVRGEAGCFAVEIMMDQQSAPQREPADGLASAARAKDKAPKHAAQTPTSPSLDDRATVRTKAFLQGQNPADYCGGIKIVEGDESGQYQQRSDGATPLPHELGVTP
jgi:hypothetical protein